MREVAAAPNPNLCRHVELTKCYSSDGSDKQGRSEKSLEGPKIQPRTVTHCLLLSVRLVATLDVTAGCVKVAHHLSSIAVGHEYDIE